MSLMESVREAGSRGVGNLRLPKLLNVSQEALQHALGIPPPWTFRLVRIS